MFFIDWLTVYQDHPDVELPVVGSEQRIIYDLKTGEAREGWVTPQTSEGSYSTTLQISCDGCRVAVTGNPSRYQRLDNLFGFETIADCISVYNRVLSQFDLPAFTANTSVSHLTGKDGMKANVQGDGAVISRIDWTRNHSVGHKNETAFIRALSTHSLPRAKTPFLYGNSQTCDWGKGSRYRYTKVYSKSYDIELFMKSKKFSQLSEPDQQYINRVHRYCVGKGVIREEHEFKAKFLKRKNLHLYGFVTESDFRPYLQDLDKMINSLAASTYDFSAISDQLMDAGVCKTRHSANSTENYCTRWMHGQPLAKTSAYYVAKKRLLEIGIDISLPLDISKKMPTIKNDREISVGSLSVPPWYRSANSQPSLQLVG